MTLSFIRPSWPPLRTRSEDTPLSSKPSGRRSPISGRPGTWRSFGTRTGDTSSRSTESLTATSFKSPCSLLRTPRTRWRAFLDSRARGRSSSSSGSTWSATYALIRSPTLSGRFRQLHRQSEGAVLGCKGGYDRTRHCNATRGNVDVAIKGSFRSGSSPDRGRGSGPRDRRHPRRPPTAPRQDLPALRPGRIYVPGDWASPEPGAGEKREYKQVDFEEFKKSLQ